VGVADEPLDAHTADHAGDSATSDARGAVGDAAARPDATAAVDAADPVDAASVDAAVPADAASRPDAAVDAARDGGGRDAWSGPSIDIDTLTGIHFGTTATDDQAANNVALINAAAERMRPVDGAPPGGSSGALIHSGRDDGSQHGLNRWYLGNVTFELNPHQPMFAEGTSPASMVYVANATAPEFEFTLDGNAANQYQVDLTRAPGPHSHRAGFFGTGWTSSSAARRALR
jgi:hypothetical protein